MTIGQIVSCRSSISIYWMLLVLYRLLESKMYKIQVREILLSSSIFLQRLLSLFDEDTSVGKQENASCLLWWCRMIQSANVWLSCCRRRST